MQIPYIREAVIFSTISQYQRKLTYNGKSRNFLICIRTFILHTLIHVYLYTNVIHIFQCFNMYKIKYIKQKNISVFYTLAMLNKNYKLKFEKQYHLK